MCLIVLRSRILGILLQRDRVGSIYSLNSEILTMLCNRVGDIGLLILICIRSCLGSWKIFGFAASLRLE